MAIKGGQLLHSTRGSIIDRIQSAGPGDLNIPETRIYELGNYNAVGSVFDTPELTFNVETVDMTTEFEGMILGLDLTNIANGYEFDFRSAEAMDIIAMFKSQKLRYNVVNGVVIPNLTLESFTYRFGVGENSTQTAAFRGDSIFYTPGQAFQEDFVNAGVGPYTLTYTAHPETSGSSDMYGLAVTLRDSTHVRKPRRLFIDGSEWGYTNTANSITLNADHSLEYDTLVVSYSAPENSYNYDQEGLTPEGFPVHESNLNIKPAAIRGNNIEIYLGNADPTPTFVKLPGIQTFESTWSVTLENEQELGNDYFVGMDYDIPDVSGSLTAQSFDADAYSALLHRLTGVPDGEVIGPNRTQALPMEVRIKNPSNKSQTLKTIYIPDARLTVPGYTGQANATFDSTLNFTSDSGQMLVYKGAR